MERLSFSNLLLIVAFAFNLGLGLLVFLKRSPHRRINVSFALFSWACSGWILAVLMIYLFRDPSWRLLWVKMSFLGPSLIPAAFLSFAIIFPREDRKLNPTHMILIALPSALFFILSFTPWMVRSVQWETLTATYGIAHSIFSVYFLSFMGGGILFLIRSYKRSVGVDRIQIKYCLLGVFLTFIPSITMNLILPILGTSRLSNLGPPSTFIMVSFVTYSILKHRLMDINIVLQKGTTYFLLVVLVFLPSSLLLIYGQKLFFDRIDSLFSVLILSVLLLVVILFEKIKERTEKAVVQLFFKDRLDYRETLGKFSRAMVTILDLQSLSKKIVETITQTMGIEKASLFVIDEERGGYRLLESRNVAVALFPLALPKGDPLPQYLQHLGEIILRDELVKGSHVPELEGVVQTMSRLEAEVSIPLISKGHLIGIINLSHKFNREVCSHDDLELLSTLANQTTIAIENAKLVEDLKKSKSYIRRADRLASLGTLTAGLAHEIRNPLVAIKTLTQLLPERLEDEEFRNHFLRIASGEVDRISSLVNELLEFARPSDPKFELADINNILDGMILLISTETKKKQISVLKEFSPNLPAVHVDQEQIKQVFLNILLNAIEATLPTGTVVVRTRSFIKSGDEPHVQVEFTDTGCGIPPEYLEDIFTPFFTTKNKGSGLGLSISNQIIQDHRGYIHVESKVNTGTSFYVNLPVDQEHQRRRRDDFQQHQNVLDPVKRL
jgi:nitrogen-specific signal transduction histidine kinase